MLVRVGCGVRPFHVEVRDGELVPGPFLGKFLTRPGDGFARLHVERLSRSCGGDKLGSVRISLGLVLEGLVERASADLPAQVVRLGAVILLDFVDADVKAFGHAGLAGSGDRKATGAP
jgi:hypothetical protein